MTELSREEVQMPLAAQLRAHSNCKASVAWEGQARMLMAWAADTIDAANAAIYEAGAKSERAVSDRLLDALQRLLNTKQGFSTERCCAIAFAETTAAEVEAMRKGKLE